MQRGIQYTFWVKSMIEESEGAFVRSIPHKVIDGNILKRCGHCKGWLMLDEFSKEKKTVDGLRNKCKKCAKKYYDKNREYHKNYRAKNAEKHKVYVSKWYMENRDRINDARRKEKTWRNVSEEAKQRHMERNKQTLRERCKNPEYNRKYRLENAERLKKWNLYNPEKAKEHSRKATAKIRNTPKGKLNANFKTAIYRSLKGAKANQHWEDIVGYTIDQLKKHLEKLFTPEMTWENYGTVWEIDHKIPIAVFNFERPEHIDFKLCWSIKNLRPLEVDQNRRKYTKLEKHFQPSLAIGMK